MNATPEELLTILKNPLHYLFDSLFTKLDEDRIQSDYRCYVTKTLVFEDIKGHLEDFLNYGDTVGLSTNNPKEKAVS